LRGAGAPPFLSPRFWQQTKKMRKILTNAVDEIEVVVSSRLDLFGKNQDFVEKRSNVFFTRRREIFTRP
jgi:hypothetical protein